MLSGEQLNALRYRYFKKLQAGYAVYDTDALAEDMSPSLGDPLAAARKTFGDGAIMKKNGALHHIVIVQTVGNLNMAPCTTPEGKRVRVGLLYDGGEICALDTMYGRTYLKRLQLDDKGKITGVEVTFPFLFRYRILEGEEA